MNNGSIITSSSVSSAAEYRGGRVSSFEDQLAGSERFDSLIDLLGSKKEEQPKADQMGTEPSNRSLVQKANREENRSNDEVDESSMEELRESARNQQHAAVNEESKVDKENPVDKKGAAKADEAKETKKEEQAPKLSSSITLRQHKPGTSGQSEEAKKTVATAESLKENKSLLGKTDTTDKKGVVAQKTPVTGKAQAELQIGKGANEKTSGASAKAAAIRAQAADSKTGTNAKAMTQSSEGGTSVAGADLNQGKKLPKSTSVNPAKTTYATPNPDETLRTEEVKNRIKPVAANEENMLKTLEREIGIKGAIHSADKQMAILAKDKSVENKDSDKAFLRDSSEPASGNRTQTVTSRSDMNGFANHNQSGTQDQSFGGREHFRQWLNETGDIRNAAQSAQQSQFVDRGTASHLSVHVLNQIMNHIERLRESDKNRVRVSLGLSEHGKISVDIRLEDGSISTSFQGDEDVLDELKRDWKDISEKASRKGVVLKDPEFISYSSSVESANSLPDSDIEQEEKSQSVIQHKDNQPMRPGLETAAAGSSSPVHSYA